MNRIASLIVIVGALIVLMVSCGQKKTKEQLYAEAKKYEREENFKEAIRVLEMLAENYPQVNFADSILFQIGQFYSNNLSDFENSIQVHKRLIEKYPTSKLAAHSLFMIGFHYANNVNDLENGRIYYKKFLQDFPDHELSSSVKWELDHLGQDINEIEFLKSETAEETKTQPSSSNPQGN